MFRTDLLDHAGAKTGLKLTSDLDYSVGADKFIDSPKVRYVTGTKMAGVFISRGMTVTIPAGGLVLSLGEDGKPTGNVTLHVHFDVCPTWLALAIRHLEDAQTKQAARIAAWSQPDETAKGAALEAEFEASMQAIMSAAVALDAFYAIIQSKLDIPETLLTKWRTKRTARYAQISEVIRMAFALKQKGFGILRQNLREIYRLRDLAVHPSGKIEAPILHPELDVGVEWRFFYFRYHNALLIVRATIEMIFQLVASAKPKNEAIQKYAVVLRPRIEPLQSCLVKFNADSPAANKAADK